MHSHDRTLVASLGFRDPDKNEPLHDLACVYICREDVSSSIAGPISPTISIKNKTVESRDGSTRWTFSGTVDRVISYSTSKEVPIVKGHDRFQTTIGFVDVLIKREIGLRWGRSLKMKKQHRSASDSPWTNVPWKEGDDRIRPRHFLTEEQFNPWDDDVAVEVSAVEVKIRPVPAGDLLRQMKLYASHVGDDFSLERVDRWVVVLGYDIDDAYRSALEDERIFPIRLGKPFDEWLAKRKTGPSRLRQI